MSKGLTEKQAEVLRAFILMSRDKGYQPSLDELSERFGITKKGISDHLKAIEKKGFIKITPRKNRSIEIINRSDGLC